MAMSVSVGSSSPGRCPTHCGYERVAVTWTTDSSGEASGTIDLAGAIQEVILVPGSASPAGVFMVRLYDVDNADIDYACGGWTGHSDVLEYIEPTVDSDRCPVVCGPVTFTVSDALSAVTDGVCIIFLKT